MKQKEAKKQGLVQQSPKKNGEPLTHNNWKRGQRKIGVKRITKIGSKSRTRKTQRGK